MFFTQPTAILDHNYCYNYHYYYPGRTTATLLQSSYIWEIQAIAFRVVGKHNFLQKLCAKGQSNRIFNQRFYSHQHKTWVLKEDTWVGGYYPLGNQLTEDIPHDQPSYVIVSHITNK